MHMPIVNRGRPDAYFESVAGQRRLSELEAVHPESFSDSLSEFSVPLLPEYLFQDLFQNVEDADLAHTSALDDGDVPTSHFALRLRKSFLYLLRNRSVL